MARHVCLLAVVVAVLVAGCGPRPDGTFGRDVAFLKRHTDAVVLSGSAGQAQVVVVPLYQGRVMTSTAEGAKGLSFGWINYDLVASGKCLTGMNPFGGEDRLWLGPEGGQFSIFFKKGDTFDLAHWQTPPAIDWGGWEMINKSVHSARFRREMHLVNCSGTELDLVATRTVRLVPGRKIKELLKVDPGANVKAVAYESENAIRNVGAKAWEKKTGLLSIWILCMFNPSPATTVVIPYVEGDAATLGPIVNDTYFGKVPADRLITKDGICYFKCDGEHRGKIGFNPKRAKPIMGSYDATNKVLTLAQYTKPEGVTDYVNSMWEIQKQPFAGDVVNSYNDGPSGPEGKMLGPFYELESSSPAAALKPGETMTHVHRTFHLVGPEEDLDRIAKATLGVGLAQIKAVFAPPPKPKAPEKPAPKKPAAPKKPEPKKPTK